MFIHHATPENISANSTYLDSQLSDGNPNAVLVVTQNWNPGSSYGKYNNYPIGLWYDRNRSKCAIFNQDRAAMPMGGRLQRSCLERTDGGKVTIKLERVHVVSWEVSEELNLYQNSSRVQPGQLLPNR